MNEIVHTDKRRRIVGFLDSAVYRFVRNCMAQTQTYRKVMVSLTSNCEDSLAFENIRLLFAINSF